MSEEKDINERIDSIKLYYADNSEVNATLVLEGGAFRGLYTAGVLDCLMDNKININNVLGISAGGLNGANYVAGNRGRSAVGILKNRDNPRFVGVRAFMESGSIVGFKVMFEDFDEIQQLNEDRLFNSTRNLYVGCTNVETGELDYLSNHLGKETFFKALQATSSMPLLSSMVEIDGQHYLDGGCNSKFPIDFALEHNMKKIVVVSTRPLSYKRKEIPPEFFLERTFYNRYPKFIEALKRTNNKYNEDTLKIEEMASKGEVFLIEPSEPVDISRLEKDVNKLVDLYELGYKDATNKMEALKTYLGLKEEIRKTEEKGIKAFFKRLFKKRK